LHRGLCRVGPCPASQSFSVHARKCQVVRGRRCARVSAGRCIRRASLRLVRVRWVSDRERRWRLRQPVPAVVLVHPHAVQASATCRVG
jgi:hypothetical protein